MQPWFQKGMGNFILFFFSHVTQTDLIPCMFNNLMSQAWMWTPSFPNSPFSIHVVQAKSTCEDYNFLYQAMVQAPMWMQTHGFSFPLYRG